ncbi:unnamed protein product [Rotaria magnacalcarata]
MKLLIDIICRSTTQQKRKLLGIVPFLSSADYLMSRIKDHRCTLNADHDSYLNEQTVSSFKSFNSAPNETMHPESSNSLTNSSISPSLEQDSYFQSSPIPVANNSPYYSFTRTDSRNISSITIQPSTPSIDSTKLYSIDHTHVVSSMVSLHTMLPNGSIFTKLENTTHGYKRKDLQSIKYPQMAVTMSKITQHEINILQRYLNK